jgi:hypothetical protein
LVAASNRLERQRLEFGLLKFFFYVLFVFGCDDCSWRVRRAMVRIFDKVDEKDKNKEDDDEDNDDENNHDMV